MKKIKKLKGFTLLELIVVMALFGMIIAVALGLLTPITRINKYATVNADAQAIEDDLRRFLQGKLQYSDRLAVYTNMKLDETTLASQVAEFRKSYHLDDPEKVPPYDGYNDTVYALKIENNDDVKSGKKVDTADRLGTITLVTYENGKTPKNRVWALNSGYYRDYSFTIDIQSMIAADTDGDGVNDGYKGVPLKEVPDGSDGYISPNNFSFIISMFKKDKTKDGFTTKILSDTGINKVVSFKLKNIVSNTNAIKDEKMIFNDGHTDSEKRFHWYDNTQSVSGNAENAPAGLTDEQSNDICIIFTTAIDIEKALA